MNIFNWIAARFGVHRVGPSVIAIAIVIMLVGAGAAALLIDHSQDPWESGLQNQIHSTQGLDADGDGLIDAIENRIGSDASRAYTLNGTVSDGWLHHWYGDSIDWSSDDLLDAPALSPPMDALPPGLQESSQLVVPTISELYELEKQWRDPTGQGGAWWHGRALDPRQWDNDNDGIADAWLVFHGLDPLETDLASRAPGDVAMTLLQKYEHGLDPMSEDTDSDGLTDTAELSGNSIIAGKSYTFEPTDPRRTSSRGDGIADGYVIRIGLDPSNQDLAAGVHVPGGITVAQAFDGTLDHCIRHSPTESCNWIERLDSGPLIDPTKWDSFGDGIPDAWALQDPYGFTHPLVDATQIELDSSAGWDSKPWDGGASSTGVVVDEHNPSPPTAFITTASDHYSFLRPSGWDEAVHGPWWGGLPTFIEPQDGALPPAVALRGWNTEVDIGLGREAGQAAEEEDLVTIRAHADPRKIDTDGDGLTDISEYYGLEGGRTSPDDSDTDGDGLTDGQEVMGGLETDPLRRDSSGSFLSDGEEYAYWTSEQVNASRALASGSTTGPNGKDYAWLFAAGLSPGDLAPTGSLRSTDTTNILSDDVDGDGLKDGEELFPNRFLRAASKDNPRPATDPAKTDTDGDALPDWWEISWSQDIYWKCTLPCSTSGDVTGWPLDPSRFKSVDIEGRESDYDISLTPSDEAGGRTFTNGLAYAYDLDPYRNDTDGDGIRDMFAIHWGVEAVPDLQAIKDAGWPSQQAAKLAPILQERGYPHIPSYVVIPPNDQSSTHISLDSNLLGMFSSREKGTWITTDKPCSGGDYQAGFLPTTGAASEAAYQEGTGGQNIPLRATAQENLEAPCWQWISYSLAHDVGLETNPWSHDSDADGLPDAWEQLYGGDLDPDVTAPGSLDPNASCKDPALHGGLPEKKDYCLTYMDAYRLGLDPTLSDSDGGGLSDWIEVALGEDLVNPRDPTDDHGEEDWDGDGLPNRVEDASGTNRLLVDTDQDGLLDGDPLAQELLEFHRQGRGAGDLCVRDGPDLIQADDQGRNGMAFRPGGPLTHGQRLQILEDAGVLFEHDETVVEEKCGDLEGGPYRLALREGTATDEGWGLAISSNYIGAGAGLHSATDSTQWDSSGDGLPDGWLVYWRDRVRTDANIRGDLDPLSPVGGEDPDQDGLTTSQEYEYARPSDWDESTHGPWWAGLNPTHVDTDADGSSDANDGWFYDSFDPIDDIDQDQDNDGIWDHEDPFPSIDVRNHGIIRRDGGSFEVNYTLLWNALEERSSGSVSDVDGDLVPDFLDRARVRVDALAIDSTKIQKGSEVFSVTGKVVLDEGPATGHSLADYANFTNGNGSQNPDGAVQGATVRVVLWDGEKEQTVGFNFTRADGSFRIDSRVASETMAVSAPFTGASVEGTVLEPGEEHSLSTLAPSLKPGNIQLAVAVEANDPTIQPLLFADQPEPTYAFKETSSTSPFLLPTNLRDSPYRNGIRALTLDDDGNPDAGQPRVLHTTEAIFANRLAYPDPITLTADAQLEAAFPNQRILVGADDITVQGRLVDDAGVGIQGETVHIEIQPLSVSGTPATDDFSTDSDGEFEFSLPTAGMQPGVYSIRLDCNLSDQASQFLNDPDSIEETLRLARDTSWVFPIEISNIAVPSDGRVVVVDAADPISVDALLKDHQGEPVPKGNVTLTLSSLQGEIDSVQGSVEDGVLDHGTLGPIDPQVVGLEDISLTVEVHKITDDDDPATLTAFLRPRFNTSLSLDDATAHIGEDAVLEGTLFRTAPNGLIPVTNLRQEKAVLLTAITGASIWIEKTGPDGRFQVPIESTSPASVVWTAKFFPPGPQECTGSVAAACYLAASNPATATVTHVAATQILVQDPISHRDQAVEVAGNLTLLDGNGLSNQTINAHWSDNPGAVVTTNTTSAGDFHLELPPRNHAGVHEIIFSFPGTDTLDPSGATASALIQVPMRIEATTTPLVIADNTTGAYLVAHLQDERNETYEGRTLDIVFTDPSGNVSNQIGLTTNTQGTIEVATDDIMLPTPGEWSIAIKYAGTDLETDASWNGTVHVRHHVTIELDDFPTNLIPGRIFEVRGSLEAESSELGAIDLTLQHQETSLDSGSALAGGEWVLRAIAPAIEPGNHTFTVKGTGPDGVSVESRAFQVFVEDAVHVTLHEVVEDDGRHIHVTMTRAGKPASDLGLTLVRRDAQGETQGVHRIITQEEGTASFRLTANETGELSVAGLSDPDLQLANVVHEVTRTVPAPPGTPWGTAFAFVAAAVGASLGITFLVWRWRRHRAVLAAMDEARRRLLDPHADPRSIIREAYDRLLETLASAGYEPGDHETVRTIADHAARAFKLHRKAMGELARLFELTVYSNEALGDSHRKRALRALERITSELHDRPKQRRVFRFPPKRDSRQKEMEAMQ